MYSHWRTYSSYLKDKYGASVYRIGVDGGFSCPNRDKNRHGGCAFCDGTGSIAVYQRTAESGYRRTAAFDKERADTILPRLLSIREQIERGMAFLKRRYGATLFSLSFQSWTNTYDSPENLKRIYDEALAVHPFKELLISTRPDTVPEDVLSLLESYITPERDVWVEFGLQSANDRTLQNINRGHDLASYMEATERAHSHHLKVATHVILGLPGETKEQMLETVRYLSNLRIDGIKLQLLHVLKGTDLLPLYEAGAFQVLSLPEYLELLGDCLRILPQETVIHRLSGDGPKRLLCAPLWSADKRMVLNSIHRYLKEQQIYQGMDVPKTAPTKTADLPSAP